MREHAAQPTSEPGFLGNRCFIVTVGERDGFFWNSWREMGGFAIMRLDGGRGNGW